MVFIRIHHQATHFAKSPMVNILWLWSFLQIAQVLTRAEAPVIIRSPLFKTQTLSVWELKSHTFVFILARANSEGTFPRLRKNIYRKSSTATIFKATDKKHYQLDDWKSDFDLVDQRTQFDVDIPLGPENLPEPKSKQTGGSSEPFQSSWAGYTWVPFGSPPAKN